MNRLYFSRFRLTKKLSWKCRGFPYYHLSPMQFLRISTSSQHTVSLLLIQWTNPHWHVIVAESMVYTGGHSCIGLATGLDKWTMTCIHHHRLMQSRPPWNSSVLHLFIPPSLKPWSHWSFYCLHSFAFPRTSCSWNHTVFGLFRLASFI